MAGEGQSYARKDGTLAYFFSVEELCARASDAGFQVLECKYATVRNVNRKTGAVLDRVFIHGLFVREGEFLGGLTALKVGDSGACVWTSDAIPVSSQWDPGPRMSLPHTCRSPRKMVTGCMDETSCA